ncbi:MAG TPA: hypothetical protein VHE57_13890, partial [Mycobacteriales bacterium]|nr:hypothetical protein [Mycobacteriales bacterium]
GAPPAVGQAVEALAHPLVAAHLVPAPRAAAAAALAATAARGSNCSAVARSIGREVSRRPHSSGSRYFRIVRFSPPLTAELALASIVRFLLPGKVHVVYALKAFSCQQAIFMGAALGRQYGNPSLGAFVQLTSGRGVGRSRYDANRVNRARITPFGRIGGQPCR